MVKKKTKVEERTIEVIRGDNATQRASDEVKKLSGFEYVMPIKADLAGKNIEYLFLVGNNETDLMLELASRRAEADQE